MPVQAAIEEQSSQANSVANTGSRGLAGLIWSSETVFCLFNCQRILALEIKENSLFFFVSFFSLLNRNLTLHTQLRRGTSIVVLRGLNAP